MSQWTQCQVSSRVGQICRNHTKRRDADRIIDCTKSKDCAPLKHHYEHCVERVTSQQEEHGKAHEDCVEECKL